MNKDIDINEAFKNNLQYLKDLTKGTLDVKNIENQFVKTETRTYFTVGSVDVTSGSIVVADPLAYLGSRHGSPVLEKKIKVGTYPVEVAILKNPYVGVRMCTVRLKIKDSKAVRYECAMPTEETAAFVAKDGIVSGFPVDAGMASISDADVAVEYDTFLNKWYQEHPDKNHYDDYFAELFQESFQKFPDYQREGGDFIEWMVPDSHHRLVMVASGFGDGFYQSFWGFDEDEEICELVVPFINPDLFE